MLDEPVAAALAPAHGPMPGPGDLMLVYDLGGGTFDVAVLEADGSGYRVVGKDGLTACGGGDIDRLLYGWFRDRADASVRELLTIGPDANAVLRQATRDLRQSLLEFLCLHVKHQLSSSRTVHDTFVASPLRVPVDMDEEEFLNLIEPVISDTVACCRELLRRSRHQPADLAAVLLVGGGARMPGRHPGADGGIRAAAAACRGPRARGGSRGRVLGLSIRRRACRSPRRSPSRQARPRSQ